MRQSGGWRACALCPLQIAAVDGQCEGDEVDELGGGWPAAGFDRGPEDLGGTARRPVRIEAVTMVGDDQTQHRSCFDGLGKLTQPRRQIRYVLDHVRRDHPPDRPVVGNGIRQTTRPGDVDVVDVSDQFVAFVLAPDGLRVRMIDVQHVIRFLGRQRAVERSELQPSSVELEEVERDPATGGQLVRHVELFIGVERHTIGQRHSTNVTVQGSSVGASAEPTWQRCRSRQP